jgi:hypothetical protein
VLELSIRSQHSFISRYLTPQGDICQIAKPRGKQNSADNQQLAIALWRIGWKSAEGI